jgi:Oligosaccaryltransferase
MITHDQLYNLANSLGAIAMITIVAYHFVAVNAKHLAKDGGA